MIINKLFKKTTWPIVILLSGRALLSGHHRHAQKKKKGSNQYCRFLLPPATTFEAAVN